MKKIFMVSLSFLFLLSITTAASAVVFSPECGVIYTNGAGNPLLIAAGVLINPAPPPMFGPRIRAGYRLNGTKGLFIAVDGVFTYPVNERADIHIGGGFNITDSNAANVTMWFGGQAYGGVTFRATQKVGIFFESGWVNTAVKAAGVYAGSNDFGTSFGVRFDMGRE